MTVEGLQKQLEATRQVLADLLQERLPKVYVIQTEGSLSKVLAVCPSLEIAKSVVERHAGRELDWRYGDTDDGGMWWPARDAAGFITAHKVSHD